MTRSLWELLALPEEGGPLALPFVAVSAPMVRYSRLPARVVFREHGLVDLAYTPMILADSFVRSDVCRRLELPLAPGRDSPLVVQFASNRPSTFAAAAALVTQMSYGDGGVVAVDLNCGCPQRWARQEGLGSALLDTPDLVAEMVRSARASMPSDRHVTAKLRIVPEADGRAEANASQTTVELARRLERMGASWLTLHARTVRQGGTGPVDLAVLADVVAGVQIPIVGNGGIITRDDANDMHRRTGCAGVMAGERLLHDPTLFRDFASEEHRSMARWQALQAYIDNAVGWTPGISTHQDAKVFVNHVHWQLHDLVDPERRKTMLATTSVSGLIAYVHKHSLTAQGSVPASK